MSILSKQAIAASIADFSVKKLLDDHTTVATVAATGSLISDGAPLQYGRNVVTAADATKAVVLPDAKLNSMVEVVNTVSNQALVVFPKLAGDQINAITAGAAFTQAAGSRAAYFCDAAGHWYVAAANLTGVATSATQGQLDIAAVPASGVETVAATNIITAAESGKTFFLDHATEFVSTLPAPAAGLNYTFIVVNPPETASYTVVTDSAAQILGGHVLPADGAAGDVESPAAGTTITFVDGAAVAGDRAYVISDGTSWYAVCSCAVATGITITG